LELIRIVRATDGGIGVDTRGRQNGRGAYVCADDACWQKAVKRGILAKHLRAPIDPQALSDLGDQFAAALAPRRDYARAVKTED
jgi:predicted RNA-binding protein YlxR (DUF448 family)